MDSFRGVPIIVSEDGVNDFATLDSLSKLVDLDPKPFHIRMTQKAFDKYSELTSPAEGVSYTLSKQVKEDTK